MLVTFDTLEYVKELKEGGFSDKQADAMAQAQKKVINEAIDNSLAAKGDINDAKLELKTDIQGVKAELLILKWMLGVVIAVEVLPLLKQFL